MHVQLQDMALWRRQAYIDGQWRNARSEGTLEVANPGNRQVLGTIPSCDGVDTRDAIEAAQAALPAWRSLTAQDRATLLLKWHDLMLAHADDLALLMTLEQGKPLSESRAEILYGASFVQWFAAEGVRAYGETIPATPSNRRIFVRKMPVGVCAAITPWNFPNAMITRKLAPALAAGCTVVVKPSELTPYSALALAELGERAGFPKGVLNIVTGAPEGIGAELTSNPTVRKLTFTGSTAVGKKLLRQCADTVKRVSLELGGNAPVIVFDDTDLEIAIAGVMASKFRNSGQTCVCANRIYVQSGIYEQFAERLATEVGKLHVGVGTEPGVSIGPLINEAALRKVEAHVEDAQAKGASIVSGGKSSSRGPQFFEPTVLTEADDTMMLAHEETFGPVAALLRFSTESEVLRRANDSPYGLAAYVFSNDVSRLFRVSESLECGMVGMNTGAISTAVAPFGGVKESGLGREGSRHGIEEFLEIQTLHLDLGKEA
ncbi:succinate-semialdehyde dehydrogenase (NADP(+)) [Variovorax sp. WS11]|uniref:NAD-dependent succinate-semialdehyde dehydrogenase n=1 Tax=Variovorax sp. WS11 TaxID=1105204 RepID=UPI000D0E19D4|nr:NAD-dependent succinate-semialdehyde dehydrogenase [Variovorax sp. WS11]NDZ11874.1 NAD-dependent succinate-semialdehyde dehydrogenase [Variovorax sp. WS11]PSL80672.1 succinate-semialdehyde dehydrogenase (NADP(+)) [Variovorax sp. WS11]